jgi:hypothetical protein
MDKPLYTFEPIKHNTDPLLVVTGTALLCLLTAIFYLYKNERLETARRNLLILILSLICLVAVSTIAFKLLSLWKLKAVNIYNDKIETPYGTTPLSNVKDFYIKLERKYRTLQPDVAIDSARYFFLLERNDKTHILSEGDYPIDSILSKLNNVLGY